MNLLQLAMAAVMIGLGLRVIYGSWQGEPPAHVASGVMGLIMLAFGLAEDDTFITAISALHAGWQLACAYMVRAGRPHVVRVRLYLDEDGHWVRSWHPSQYRDN